MATNIQPRRAPGGTQPFVTLNPAPVIANRAPTTFDNYEPSTIWIQQVDASGNPVNDIWILASVQNGQANWIEITPDGGTGEFSNIFLPDTNTSQTQGVIFFGNDPWIIRYGTDNVFLGLDAGNTTMDLVGGASQNTGIGNNSLNGITTGFINTAVGLSSGQDITSGYQNDLFGGGSGQTITSGYQNTAIGHNSLSGLITGNNVIAVGQLSASHYTGAEEQNICIGNQGVMGESNTIRLGDPTFHDETFIAGKVVTSGSLSSAGDTAGVNGEIGFSNVTNTTQESGTLSIASTTTNNGRNTGFIKFYVNGVVSYVPYFTNIAP